ncbi:MAG: hypothetical protein AAFV37_10430 [Pseudomonadota bacterium]
MFQVLNSVLGGVQSVIQIGACLLIGTMMVFAVGLPLLIGGRPEALIPIGIGSMAFWTVWKRTKSAREALR